MHKQHTFLVAIQISDPDGLISRKQAENYLCSRLPRPGHALDIQTTEGEVINEPYVECWWVAEDDRHDRSDNDSAVFVNYGDKGTAFAILHQIPNADGRPLSGDFNAPGMD